MASYLLSVALFVAAGLRPALLRTTRTVEYLVIFDVTLSMATEDYRESGPPASRLEVAKRVFRDALARLPAGARVSLAGFAGRTVQLFLLSRPASDTEAIDAALGVLEWDNVWEVGSRLDLGLQDVARQVAGAPVYRFTGNPSRPASLPSPLNVVFFTDGGGDDLRPSLPPDVAGWFRQQARLLLVGVGQTWPSPVPEWRRGPGRDCLRDAGGGCVTSRLHEANLQVLARQTGGRYLRLGDPGSLSEALSSDPLPAGTTRVPVELGRALGLASLLLFVLYVLV